MTDTELEERLTAMLHRRADELTGAPSFRLEPTGRSRHRLAPLGVAAAVAAVVIAVGGTVVGIRSIHHATPAASTPAPSTPAPSSPTPSASTTTCTVGMPASWQRAISAGTIPLDHPYNEVISVRPGTGEYLVRQLTAQPTPSGLSGQATLALFDGKNGQDIATLPEGTEPVADGSAAIDAGWIVYGVHRPGGNSNYSKVVLHDRRTGHDRVLDQAGDADSGDQLIGDPVLFGGKVYWSEVNFAQNHSTIKSYDLSSGVTDAQPLPAVAIGLLDYGTGLAIERSGESSTSLANYLGAPLAQPVLAAAAGSGAEYFTFDGGTLRWWSGYPADVLYSNRPGSATVERLVVPAGSPGEFAGVNTWPFVATAAKGAGMVDLRANVLVSLPRGTDVLAVLDGKALIGTGADPLNTGLSLVPLDRLAPAHC
ncbi:MAG TPA: hypothetical protein VFU36_04530 [Jatrophihabitans sp.]|nr:hypothetical protein [Jatrophihabitans sp.]